MSSIQPDFLEFNQSDKRVYINIEFPAKFKLAKLNVKCDNRQLRITPPGKNQKPIVQGIYFSDVIDYKVNKDDSTNTLSIDLLKGVLKETWTSLFRAARTSTIEKVHLVIEDYEAKDSVELSLVAGQLVIVLNEVDEEWAKGQRFGDEQVVGLFPLRCTQELDAEQVEAEKERALRLRTQLQLAASKEKQAALAKFYSEESVASTAQATSPRVLSGGADEQEFDWDEFPTCVHEAIAFDQRRWASGPQPPKGQFAGWLSKLAEKNLGGGTSLKGFGKKLMRSVSSKSVEGWQRRYCVLDSEQQSFVYGVLHREGAFNQSWELKGDIFLGAGCQVTLLKFQISGRPACIRLRPRLGSKIKEYVLAAESVNQSKKLVAAMVAAGATQVDEVCEAPLPAPGVHSAVLHKLGGGALKEWQPRWLRIEADGTLSYWDMKHRQEINEETRVEYYLKGTMSLPMCHVAKHNADPKTRTPAKFRYQFTLKQSAGGKLKENKEYFWACRGSDDRNQWLTILQEYGAVCLENPNAVTLKLQKMPPLRLAAKTFEPVMDEEKEQREKTVVVSTTTTQTSVQSNVVVPNTINTTATRGPKPPKPTPPKKKPMPQPPARSSLSRSNEQAMSVAARGRRQPQLPPRRGVSLTLNSDEPPAKPAPARSRPRVPAHDAQPPRTGGAIDEQRSPRQLPVLPPKSSTVATPTAAAAPSHDSVSPRTMDKKQRLEILRKKKAELAARRAAVEAKREQLSDDADVDQPHETRSSPRADAIEALDVLLNDDEDEAPPIDAMSALDALLDDD